MLFDIFLETRKIVALAEYPYIRHIPYRAITVNGNEGGDSSSFEKTGVVGLSISSMKGGRRANVAFKGGDYTLRRGLA